MGTEKSLSELFMTAQALRGLLYPHTIQYMRPLYRYFHEIGVTDPAAQKSILEVFITSYEKELAERQQRRERSWTHRLGRWIASLFA